MASAANGSPRRDPDFAFERAFWRAGMPLVAGVDEVGRGALAGPLVAAAVVFPAKRGAALRRLAGDLNGVRDSKLLAPGRRVALLETIHAEAVAVGIGMADPAELDEIGLAAANRAAMERAVLALPGEPDALLLDACTLDLGIPQVGPIDADARCLSVAAASIVAKVARDALMVAADAVEPRYGFADHKGYGSAFHLAMLDEHGPCPLHRRSFAPVARCAAR